MGVKEELAKHGLRAVKSLGQNFLCDEKAIADIITAVNPGAEDFVLEIGPGLGALSKGLAALAGGFAAVELDRALAEILAKELPMAEIICRDFLKLDLSRFKGHPSLKIVGSLPYYITAPCLRKIFNAEIRPVLAVLVMQKEAARKLVAEPGSEGYCLLTLEAAYFGRTEIVRELSPSSFYPQPGVWSLAVKLIPHNVPPAESDRERLFKVIRAAFSSRRKTLVNCLAHGLGVPKAYAAQAVKKSGFAAEARGEELGLRQFDILTKILFDNGRML